MNRASGFSLIELMMVVTVAAVLSVVSFDTFKSLRQNSSVSGEVSDFMGQMEYARAEALREGQTVSICVSTTGSSCTGGTSWDGGYIVFSDVSGNGSYGSGDVILRKQHTFTSTDTLTASNSMSYFTFNRLGFVNNIPASTPSILMTGHAKVPSSASTQCVSVSVVGQLAKVAYSLGGCS